MTSSLPRSLVIFVRNFENEIEFNIYVRCNCTYKQNYCPIKNLRPSTYILVRTYVYIDELSNDCITPLLCTYVLLLYSELYLPFYERAEFVRTPTGKNTTKNMISTDSNYEENHTNIRCRKTSNEDNLVRTQFEKFSCNKHYLYLQNLHGHNFSAKFRGFPGNFGVWR